MDRGKLQLLTHDHSLKFRSHRYTSYPGLLFLLLIVGILLLGASVGASGAPPVVNPQSGSVGLTGIVRGPAPSQPAVIGSPRSGSVTTTVPITVSGTCPLGTFVNIEKNGVFGGATECGSDGTFSLLVDLFVGANRLVARVSDALGQFGPDSAPVDIRYDAPDNAAGGVIPGRQLFIEADETVTGGEVGASLSHSVTLVGGTGPYAVSWDFGDGSTALESVNSEGKLTKSHAYTRAGTYHVIVQVTDSVGRSAFLQLVTVVNGATAAGTTGGSGSGSISGALVAAWPLLLLAILLVVAFWSGERRQARKDVIKMRLAEGYSEA